jgi:hypothetical protein
MLPGKMSLKIPKPGQYGELLEEIWQRIRSDAEDANERQREI